MLEDMHIVFAICNTKKVTEVIIGTNELAELYKQKLEKNQRSVGPGLTPSPKNYLSFHFSFIVTQTTGDTP